MPQILSQLSLNEISLVDNPANSSVDPLTGNKIPHARIALFKRDGAPNPTTGVPIMTLEQIENKQIEQDALLAKMATDTAATATENGVLKSRS
jgi:hypothetical protein